MIYSTLRLFNAVQVSAKQEECEIPRDIYERTIRNGYVLNPHICPTNIILDAVEDIVGISGEKANAAFHKSWSVVQDSPIEVLVIQQIMHYLTTYGFEALGIYQEETVYIPNEVLELPEVGNIPLTVVKAMTADEILAKIVELGSYGIALAQRTLDDIMIIVKANRYEPGFVEKITNRELRALLYDYYNLVPSEPVEFLRHLVSKLTGESLLIKNDELIGKIKVSNGKFLDMLLNDAPDDLASIFYRFKPLFLAMKSISNNKAFFNRLRKKAKKMHAPLPEDFLNSVTAHIKHGGLNEDRLAKRLETASTFRKIRLAYALSYRLSQPYSILYQVRHGRGWVTDFAWHYGLHVETQRALDIVCNSISDGIRKKVEGQTFYIPANVHYALPATEKQFTGNLPTGSWVSVPEDLIVGIHWENTLRRIDLDLSVIGVSGKIGWDASYRTAKRDVLFSGDVTDAPGPKGASELFYIKKGINEPRILVVNYYNYNADDPVPCKIITAHDAPKNFRSNYMVDINKIVCSANVEISRKQNVLGLVINVNGENRVYFANVVLGNSITSGRASEHITHARNYLVGRTLSSIDLANILKMAGASVVHETPERDFVNLSPEALGRESVISIFS